MESYNRHWKKGGSRTTNPSRSLNGNDTVQKNSYEYDKTANFAARNDHVHGMREDFLYDKMNRLTGIVEDNDTTACFNYDAYGRMLRKYMHSALVFDSASYNADSRPHAIAQAQTPLDLPLHSMRYTHFDKLAYLEQDTLALSYIYGYEHQRLHSTEADIHGDTLRQKEYIGNCEYIDNGMYTTALTYLSGPLGVFGVQEKRDGYRPDRYFIHPDHLGSWTLVTDSYANVIQDVAYDAWGTPYCFNATGTEPATSLLFDRGFTGHEHLYDFGLINMNGRMYDPIMSSFLSVDSYVQQPNNSQNFNRYAYCLNNPLKYTDPDGEIALTTLAMVGIGIATVMGGYTGYNIAVSKGYGFDDWQTYGYMLGGAAIGFAAGYTGAYLVAGGGFMANTAGIYASSLVNCTGMTMLSGGSYSPPISFGAVSYDPMTGEWGYLGKEGNSPLQNLGYGFGALANLQDIVAGVNGANIQVKSRKELAGHSELGSYSNNGNYQDGDILVSVGPNAVVGSSDYDVLLAMENKISIPTDDGVAWELPFVKATLKGKSVSGINEQIIRSDDSQFITTINNVNGKILHNMTNNLNAGRNLINTGNLKYGLFYGCVNYTSRALAMSGVLNVNAFLPVTAPVLLNLELAIRNIGIYASPYLIQY